MIKTHWSDCAIYNEPAYPIGECDCGYVKGKRKMNKLKKSWTLYFNSICAALVIMLPEIQAALETQLTADQYRQAASIFILVNIALRFKTAAQAQATAMRDEQNG